MTATSIGPDAVEFRKIYRDHFRFVWSILLRLGVHPPAIEDACQETFLVVHRRLGDFQPHGNQRAWLFGIARRVAFRMRRSRQRTARKLSALTQERPTERTLEALVAERQLSTLLLSALDELDEEKRTALVLHVFEEMSGPEVAALLGLKVDTAYSRIKAGRRALERVLARRGVGEELSRLVRLARTQTEPPAGARRKVAGLLALPLAAPTAPALASLTWKGLLLAAAVPGLALAVGLALRSPASSESAVPTAAARPQAPEPPSPQASVSAAVVAPAQPESVVAPATAMPPVRMEAEGIAPKTVEEIAKPEPPSLGLGAEVALLEQATAALRDDDPAHALSLLAEHARRFPAGQLAGERRAYRAVALCSMGNTTQGRAEARLVRASGPSQALRVWLDSACGVSSPTDDRTGPTRRTRG